MRKYSEVDLEAETFSREDQQLDPMMSSFKAWLFKEYEKLSEQNYGHCRWYNGNCTLQDDAWTSSNSLM
jgi:hypothetical protein